MMRMFAMPIMHLHQLWAPLSFRERILAVWLVCVSVILVVRAALRARVAARRRHTRKIPIAFMLPLDVVSPPPPFSLGQECTVNDRYDWDDILPQVLEAHVVGVALDVWWGLCEPAPRVYRWHAYRELFRKLRQHGLRIQVVLSYHACGGNVGDTTSIPLPTWVQSSDDDLWYHDAHGNVTKEYLSLWAMDAKLQDGRTVVTAYKEFASAFASEFDDMLTSGTITHVCIGCGPCGEARYPSYPLDKWEYPGMGAFQCFDRRAKAAWTAAAPTAADTLLVNLPAYNGTPTGHFWETASIWHDGRAKVAEPMADSLVFISWYARCLRAHVSRMVTIHKEALLRPGPQPRTPTLVVKVPGIHWWAAHPSRAAECAAGLIDPAEGIAYSALARTIRDAGAELDFTCLEMRDNATAPAFSAPFTLVRHMRALCASESVALSAENALFTTSQADLDRMAQHLQARDGPVSFTLLRLCDELLDDTPWHRIVEWTKDVGLPR